MKTSKRSKRFQVGGSTDQNEIIDSRMQAVQQLVEQGVSDPEEIVKYLNYDDEGNEVGDFSEEEVAEYIQNIENPELPEYQSPYSMEEEESEGEEEEASEEETEEEPTEEMKRGGSFMKFQGRNSQVDPMALELAKRGFGEKPKKWKDVHAPEGMDFTLNPKGDAIFLGGYPTKADSIIPMPNMPGVGIGYIKGKAYPVATDKKKKAEMKDWMKEHSTFYKDKEGYITPYYYMYGGNTPGGSNPNIVKKFKKGGFPMYPTGGGIGADESYGEMTPAQWDKYNVGKGLIKVPTKYNIGYGDYYDPKQYAPAEGGWFRKIADVNKPSVNYAGDPTYKPFISYQAPQKQYTPPKPKMQPTAPTPESQGWKQLSEMEYQRNIGSPKQYADLEYQSMASGTPGVQTRYMRPKEGTLTWQKMQPGYTPGAAPTGIAAKKKGGAFKPLLKKGGNTYGTGTESYLNEMKDGFMTGMKDLVSTAQMQNQLKAMGLPNNALKMGGSPMPKFQYMGNWNGNDRTYSDFRMFPGYNPYDTSGWNAIAMGGNRDIGGSDLLRAFPELSKSLAGSKPTVTYKRGMFGFGPIQEGTISWEDYAPGKSSPQDGNVYIPGVSPSRGGYRPPLQGFFEGLTRGYQGLREKSKQRQSERESQQSTGEEKTPFWKRFTPEGRQEARNKRMMKYAGPDYEVGNEEYKYGGNYLSKFQLAGENQPYAYDPSQDDAFAETSAPSVYTPKTGYDPLGIGESAGDLSDPNRQLIDPAGPLGEETEPFPTKQRTTLKWGVNNGEEQVRNTLGRLSKATSWIENAQQQGRDYRNVKRSSAHTAGFGTVPQGISGQKGDYMPNVLTVNFRPPDYTPVQFTGQAPRTPSRTGQRFQANDLGYGAIAAGTMFAQTGGQSFSNMADTETEEQTDYQVGGEYFLTDDEIARLEEMGGQVKIIG